MLGKETQLKDKWRKKINLLQSGWLCICASSSYLPSPLNLLPDWQSTRDGVPNQGGHSEGQETKLPEKTEKQNTQ